MRRYVLQYCTKYRAQESTDQVSWYRGRRNTDRLIVSVRTHAAMTRTDGGGGSVGAHPHRQPFHSLRRVAGGGPPVCGQSGGE